MVLGIVSLVMCWFVTGIPAIIVGNAAKREIAASGGAEDGEGMAKAGVIMGWIATVISVVGLAFYVVIIVLAVSLGSRAEDRFEPLEPTGSDYCNDYDEYTWNDC